MLLPTCCWGDGGSSAPAPTPAPAPLFLPQLLPSSSCPSSLHSCPFPSPSIPAPCQADAPCPRAILPWHRSWSVPRARSPRWPRGAHFSTLGYNHQHLEPRKQLAPPTGRGRHWHPAPCQAPPSATANREMVHAVGGDRGLASPSHGGEKVPRLVPTALLNRGGIIAGTDTRGKYNRGRGAGGEEARHRRVNGSVLSQQAPGEMDKGCRGPFPSDIEIINQGVITAKASRAPASSNGAVV